MGLVEILLDEVDHHSGNDLEEDFDFEAMLEMQMRASNVLCFFIFSYCI